MRTFFGSVAHRLKTFGILTNRPQPTQLGRWRNVSRDTVDSVDPGYPTPKKHKNTVSDDFVRLFASWTM